MAVVTEVQKGPRVQLRARARPGGQGSDAATLQGLEKLIAEFTHCQADDGYNLHARFMSAPRDSAVEWSAPIRSPLQDRTPQQTSLPSDEFTLQAPPWYFLLGLFSS